MGYETKKRNAFIKWGKFHPSTLPNIELKKNIPAPNIPFSWIVHYWNEAKNPKNVRDITLNQWVKIKYLEKKNKQKKTQTKNKKKRNWSNKESYV